MANEHTIFVYGTLQRNYGNHRYLKGADFLGPAVTLRRRYQMFNVGFPMVTLGGNSRVLGEVYRCDKYSLRSMDSLEGHPNWYQRTPETFILNPEGEGEAVQGEFYLMLDEAIPEKHKVQPNHHNILVWPGKR